MEAVEASRRIVGFLTDLSSGPVPAVRLWDGTTWGPEGAVGTLVLNHPGALRKMLRGPGDVAAGEAYVFGDVDFEGDVFSLLYFGADLGDALGPSTVVELKRRLRKLPSGPSHKARRPSRRVRLGGRVHSVARDRRAVRYHYDTGNDFFELFLDPQLVYSCAYFLSPTEDLATAQARKLDLICRKLQLEPGRSFLDVGCGWGALAVHAAVNYGVHATGITLSREQASAARARAEAAGVSNRVQIHEMDYRELEGRFDAIASVGMFEHVGRQRLASYFDCLRRLLAPGGQLLNHGIVTNGPDTRPSASFIRTYVFPDGDLRPLAEVTERAVASGFEVRDVESLRMSYALTLRRWVANLENRRDEAIRLVGEHTYRIWRLYMAGSAVAFERNAISVVQMLLTDDSRPWTYGRSGLLAADDVSHSSAARSRAQPSESVG